MKLIKLLALAAIVAVFAIPAIAQADQCNDENKAAWYKTFFDNYKGETPAQNQKVAYDAAKKYLGACPDDPNDVQAAFMKKFVKRMDERDQKVAAGKACDDAIKAKKYAEEMRVCKDVLATDPDNVNLNTILGVAGLAEASLLNESANYARKAVQLIESGKPVTVYTHDQALAYLNWTIAKTKLASAPADALTDLLKVAKLETEVKKNPGIYLDLASAYEAGPRAKYSTEYTASLNPDKTETAQSKVILENLNRVIDNQIDAMARAAATAPADGKPGIVAELAKLYKYRNKDATDAKVNELVASVLSKPIPDVPTPVTSVPTTPASTPAANSGASANGASGTTAPNGSKRPH
jgi:predicted HicB family RNase H-like nuclease